MTKKRRDLRLLVNTNGLHGYSGYSTEMKDVLYRLVKDGWKVAVSANHGIQGGPIYIPYPREENPKLQGLEILHYPLIADPSGSEGIYYHALDFRAHAVMSMQDIWTLNPQFLSKMRYWIPYFPVDKEPIPVNVLEKLKFAYKAISFSQFGYDVLQEAGYVSDLIIEGTDSEIFKPLDQQKIRKELGLPADAFMFVMVAANKENPPRKGFQEAMEAFKLFHDKHPEAAMLFSIQQNSPTGFPVKQFAYHLGIEKRMFFTDDYSAMFKPSSVKVNQLYNASDVLLSPSQTEGFGLTIIEAQAAGKPAIVQRCQSMPELIQEGKTGFIAETLYKRFTPDLSYVHVADPKSVYEQMEKAYALVKNDPNKTKVNCRNNVVDNFNIDTIVQKKWIPYLEELQEEILPPVKVDKKKKKE